MRELFQPGVGFLLFILFSAAVGGCGSSSTLVTTMSRELNVSREVGYRSEAASAFATASARATHLLAHITSRVDRRHVNFSIQITDGPAHTAYAWPDGTIVLGSGLMHLLNDAELSAVLAHEAAHLLSHSPARAPQALKGSSHLRASDAVEQRADQLAGELLFSTGGTSLDLARALAKVRNAPGTPPWAQPMLDRRIAAIMELQS